MHDATESKIAEQAIPTNCPGWCEGGDHEPLIPGEPVEHWANVGYVHSGRKEWEVTVAQPVERAPDRFPLVQIGSYDYDAHAVTVCKMTSVEARSIAALLLRAADRIELQ